MLKSCALSRKNLEYGKEEVHKFAEGSIDKGHCSIDIEKGTSFGDNSLSDQSLLQSFTYLSNLHHVEVDQSSGSRIYYWLQSEVQQQPYPGIA